MVFVRSDLPGGPEIRADIGRVSATARGTTLGEGPARVMTVEHLLAAVAGLRIDNLIIEMEGAELPMGDGSARPYADMINRAGIEEQPEERKVFFLRRPVFIGDEKGGLIIGLPFPVFRVAATIAFSHRLLDAQYLDCEITPPVFHKEIAPARTFGFYRDAIPLMKKGLIKGSSLDNTVVITEDAIVSREGLRFKDEFVRHKVLDLIGDLALLGMPLAARIVAVKPGHALNIAFVRKLQTILRGDNKGGTENE